MIKESSHPLVKHKLSILREYDTSHKKFRELVNELTMFLTYDALSNMEIREKKIDTPVVKDAKGYEMVNDVIVVPILRAGVGMLDGILNLIPTARVGFVGMYRDPETKNPNVYYEKLPENVVNPQVVIVDPMLATGGSIVATLDMIKEKGFDKILVISIIAAPEGLKVVQDAHPDVDIFVANIDDQLNDHQYIVPGLGDAGDRLFGTK